MSTKLIRDEQLMPRSKDTVYSYYRYLLTLDNGASETLINKLSDIYLWFFDGSVSEDFTGLTGSKNTFKVGMDFFE